MNVSPSVVVSSGSDGVEVPSPVKGDGAAEVVEFEHRGKVVRLFKRAPGVNWYVRKVYKGTPYLKGLGSPIVAVAKANAKFWLDKLMSDRWDEVDAMKLKSVVYGTVGDVREAYMDGAVALLGNDAGSVYQNAMSLDNVVRRGLGLATREEARARPLSVLSQELVDGYIMAQRKAGRVDASIRSALGQARAMFRPEVLRLYKNIKLPVLAGFLEGSEVLKVVDDEWVPFRAEQIAGMEGAAAELRVTDAEVWKVYVLMARLGMRNCEVLATRREWFEARQDGTVQVSIRNRTEEEFSVKNNLSRRVTVPAGLWAQLEPLLPASGPVVVGSPERTAHFICNKGINNFVRPFMPERTKKSYELRKWAGSIVATLRISKVGMEGAMLAAKTFLGHRTVSTTEKYYATYLKTVEGVTHADMAEMYS